jgi:hypothetical protein
MIRTFLAVALTGTIAFAADASADSTYDRRCFRDANRVLQCRYETETSYGKTTTWCASRGYRGNCETETVRKGPPPEPTIEHSDRGVLIMRGGPR